MSPSGPGIPSTAKALLHNVSDHSLRLTSLPTPFPPPPGFHLLAVRATGLTSGELLWPEPASIPNPVPGFDVAGVVLTHAANSPFTPGDHVFARTDFDRQGSAREYTLATIEELARVPSGLEWAEAASIPLSALTAWQVLFTHGGLALPAEAKQNEGKSVLVTAASGSVGIWTVQLAREAGCYVVGTCSEKNVSFVKEDLGANEVLDYGKSRLMEWVSIE